MLGIPAVSALLFVIGRLTLCLYYTGRRVAMIELSIVLAKVMKLSIFMQYSLDFSKMMSEFSKLSFANRLILSIYISSEGQKALCTVLSRLISIKSH